MIAGLHEIIAFIGRAPEMSLEKSEADLLATTTVPVLEQFNVAPDPRILVVLAWGAAVAKVEGPRIFLIRERLKQEAQNRRANNARPVAPSTRPPEQTTNGFSHFEPITDTFN